VREREREREKRELTTICTGHAGCPPTTEWVVVTNGDNLYDDKFVEAILDTPENVDVVALDFYSRYQRPTGESSSIGSLCWRYTAEQEYTALLTIRHVNHKH